jgi:hypothetical protein
VLAAFVSSRIGLGGSAALLEPVSEAPASEPCDPVAPVEDLLDLLAVEVFVDLLVELDVVDLLFVEPNSASLASVLPSLEDFGVGVCSGIFGGVALIVVGVPGLGVGVTGVVVPPGVLVPPGVVGLGEGAVVVRGVFTASATTGFGEVLFIAAYAATDAPAASSAVTPRIVAGVRQPRPLPRLPGAPAPHCRHQSCSGCIGEPHFAHARCCGCSATCAVSGPDPLDADPLDVASCFGLVSNVLTAPHSCISGRANRRTAPDGLSGVGVGRP